MRVARDPRDAVGAVGGLEVLVVGLVEHDDDVARHRRDERLERPPAAIHVPVGLFGLATNTTRVLRRDRGAHRGEVVAEIARRHLDAGRAARLRRERIDGERVLRVDRLVARAQERVRRELEDVVAAVAEDELLGRDAEARAPARPSARSRCRRDSACSSAAAAAIAARAPSGSGPRGFSFDASLTIVAGSRPNSRASSSIGLPGMYGAMRADVLGRDAATGRVGHREASIAVSAAPRDTSPAA